MHVRIIRIQVQCPLEVVFMATNDIILTTYEWTFIVPSLINVGQSMFEKYVVTWTSN